MENLLCAIGPADERGWTFISDRQKRLKESFKEGLPNADIRFCMRHMYANFRILFKGKDLKDLMWGAACAYTVPEFELKMNQLLQLNPEAHEWLLKEPPQHWARCFFSPMP